MFVKKNISAKNHRFFSQTINIVRMTPLHCPWFEGPLVNNKWPFVGKQPQERPEDGPGCMEMGKVMVLYGEKISYFTRP